VSRFLLLVRSYPSETGRLRERFDSFDMKRRAFPRGDLREGLVEHALDIHTHRRVDAVWAQQEYGPALERSGSAASAVPLRAACCGGMHVVRPAHESGTPHTLHTTTVVRSRHVISAKPSRPLPFGARLRRCSSPFPGSATSPRARFWLNCLNSAPSGATSLPLSSASRRSTAILA